LSFARIREHCEERKRALKTLSPSRFSLVSLVHSLSINSQQQQIYLPIGTAANMSGDHKEGGVSHLFTRKPDFSTLQKKIVFLGKKLRKITHT